MTFFHIWLLESPKYFFFQSLMILQFLPDIFVAQLLSIKVFDFRFNKLASDIEVLYRLIIWGSRFRGYVGFSWSKPSYDIPLTLGDPYNNVSIILWILYKIIWNRLLRTVRSKTIKYFCLFRKQQSVWLNFVSLSYRSRDCNKNSFDKTRDRAMNLLILNDKVLTLYAFYKDSFLQVNLFNF